MKKMRTKFMNLIKKKWLRDTTMTILLIVIIIGSFIGINLWVQTMDLEDIDVTKEKLYTLSEESIKQTKEITNDVTIMIMGNTEGSNYENILDLVKQYHKYNEHITAEYVDLTQRPDIASKYSISDVSQMSLFISIQSGERETLLTSQDLYAMDYTTYQQIDKTEQKITNSIVGVTLENPPVVYFLTGHNEKSINKEMATLAAYIENESNQINTLNLLVTNQVPEDCTVLVIASPTTDFSDNETNLIKEYINQGGKILWMQDSELKQQNRPNIESILALYGVTIPTNGIVFEQDTSKMASETPDIILPDIATTNFTEQIASDGGVFLFDATKIDIVDTQEQEKLGVTVEEILTTSQQAFYRTNFTTNAKSAIEEEEEQSFLLGASITKNINENTTSKLIVYGNSLFATDYLVSENISTPMISIMNNKDLVLNSISELAQREDTITIRKDTGTVTYTATQAQHRIVLSIIFGIPVLIILAGILVWQMRRRKK